MRSLVLLALAFVAGCGTESTLRLGPGDDGLAPVTVAEPPGGTFRELPSEVRLSTSEPATIHYTLDGSAPTEASASEASPVLFTGLDGTTTIRFFAIDFAGHVEAEKSEVYTLDLDAPAAVTGLSVAVSGSDAALSWANPPDPDFAGVLVARSRGILDAPVPGQTYEAGDALSSLTEVLFVGTAESFADVDLAPQFLRYGVWAFDGVHNYSRIAAGAANVPIGVRTATVTVNVPALTATVSGATPVLSLSAGTPTFNSGTLSVPLTLTNLAVRPVHNPKVVVVSTSAGISFSNEDPGTFDGEPQRHFGAGLLPSQGVSRTLTFTGVGAGSTVTLGIEVVESPTIVFPEWGVGAIAAMAGDCGTGRVFASIDGSIASEGVGQERDYFTAVAAPDGTHLLAAARQNPRIDRIDLVTLQPTSGVSLTFSRARASIASMVLDPSGATLYAVLTDGNHPPRWTGSTLESEVYLVRLDTATLTETGRLRLSTPLGTKIRGRRLAMSPDGSLLAIPVRDFGPQPAGWIAFVQLPDFTELDTDPATEGTQALLVSPTAAPSEVEFGADGTRLYGNASDGFQDRVLIVDMTNWSLSTIATTQPNSLALAPDGRLFIGTWSGVRVYDPATGGALTTVPGAGSTGNVVLTPSGNLLIRRPDLAELRDGTSGTLLQSWPSPGGDVGGNWVVTSPF